MKRTMTIVGVAILLGMTTAEDKKLDPVKQAMKSVNGKGGYAVIINNELAKDTPDWEKIAKATAAMKPLIEEMAKTTRKEKAQQWGEYVKAYNNSSQLLAKAVDAKDKTKAENAFAGMKNCKSCHTAFAPYMPTTLPKE